MKKTKLALMEGKITHDGMTVYFANGSAIGGYIWKDDIDTNAICLTHAITNKKNMSNAYDYIMNLY